jgi:hypothetical protein
MIVQVRCPICGDDDRWETDSRGNVYCECRVCECGGYEQHEPGCRWED